MTIHSFPFLSLARREALEKSQRTDGESTATGSSTPSANSSSSSSSVGQESSSTPAADQSLSTSHHLAVCPTLPSNNSDSSTSDPSLINQSAHSPNYSQQPLALTTNGRSTTNNNNKSLSMNNNYRKETFPINHIRQHLIPGTTNNNNLAPYLKL